jgi:GTP-binding protein
MKPVLVLVGRPNVGKSTLFNRLTRSRDALVADFPGLTRDRHYGEGRGGAVPFIVVDTGGFEPGGATGLVREMAAQAELAISEADIVVFVLDAREGLTHHDRRIAQRLRATGRPVLLAINKAEGLSVVAGADFHELGLGAPLLISAAHGDGVADLLELALQDFVPPASADGSTPDGGGARDHEAADDATDGRAAGHRVRVAIVGRPNVGKSTLANALLGEERMIAFDQPGTTRDAIDAEFEFGGQGFTLIDTAGLRRRGRVFEAVEKFSVIKTLQAIEGANVAILLLDADGGVGDQDAHIAGFILETGRALVVAVNKWDAPDAYARTQVQRDLDHRLHFLDWARLHYISARDRTGLGPLMRSVVAAHQAAFAKLSTPRLTRALQAALERQAPPRNGRFRPKPRYAHQGGRNPPVIVIHGSGLNHVPDGYRRYLERWFRDQFELAGTPLRIEFRSTVNPYAGRAQ